MHSLGCKQNPVCVPKSVAQFPQSAKICKNSIINYFSTKKCYFGSNVVWDMIFEKKMLHLPMSQ